MVKNRGPLLSETSAVGFRTPIKFPDGPFICLGLTKTNPISEPKSPQRLPFHQLDICDIKLESIRIAPEQHPYYNLSLAHLAG